MTAADQSILVARHPEAQIMSAAYGLLGFGLTPPLPPDFPRLPGFSFFSHLTVSEKLTWWSEVSYMGLAATSPEEDLLVIIGTHDPLGWLKDFIAFPRAWTTLDGYKANVESGFASVYNEITLQNSGESLRSYVGKLSVQKKPLRVIGHSLGAAVGGLISADAYLPHFTLFAMPIFGDLGITRHIMSKARDGSVVPRNVRDVVPMAPPFPLYQSILPEAWFNSDVLGVPGGEGDRHNMQDTYLKACTP